MRPSVVPHLIARAIVVAMVASLALAAVAHARVVLAKPKVGTLQVINDSLLGADIKDSTITSRDIASNTIMAIDLSTNSVSVEEITENAVRAEEIAAGAVGNAELADNAVTASKIANSAVGNSELAENSVTASRIASNSVGQSEIAVNGVDTAEIDASAVTVSELANGAVSVDKVAAAPAVALTFGGGTLAVASGVPLALDPTPTWGEALDTAGMYDIATHPAYVVAPRTGWYHISGRIQWAPDDAPTVIDQQLRKLSIVTTDTAGNNPINVASEQDDLPPSAGDLPQAVDAVVRLAQNERVYLEAYQLNVGAQAINVAAADSTVARGAAFRVVWIGN